MLNTETLYSYEDVAIKPAVLSNVQSRSECNPYLEDGKLPIFTAPMSTVVNLDNREKFEENNIYTILPRNIDFEERYNSAIQGKWAAFSLNEFIDNFCNPHQNNNTENVWKVLIDIANGHMRKLYDVVKESKKIHGDKIQIMVGNIANPETYEVCCNAGADYVRISIGTGCGCITTSNTGIGYPIASLLDKMYPIKLKYMKSGFYTKVIADGGIRNFDDVTKALALGADYVMIGGLFASMKESAGETIEINGKPHKVFFGMASKEGQIAINGEKTKTSEGIKKLLPITCSLKKWSKNMSAYMRSVMSYCNVTDIKDFNATNITVNVVSNNAKKSINK